MKRFVQIILSAAIAVTLCFSSCTKKPEKLIVGKWKIVSAHSSDISNLSDDKGEIWRFKENGTFEGYFGFLEEIVEKGFVESHYNCDGETIVLRGGNLEGNLYDDHIYECVFTFDIDEITKDALSISGKLKFTESSDGEIGDIDIVKLSYELEKNNL